LPTDLKKLPHHGIQSLVPYSPGKSIEALKKETGLNDIIKMASNENPLGCSPQALLAIQTMLSCTVATYPSAHHHPLMEKLAKQLNVTTNQLLLSNGSDSIFNLLIACFALHSNKHILIHQYAFSAYEIQANILQVPVHTTPVKENFQVDVERLVAQCNEQTGLIFISNPNNPTGLLIDQEQIHYLIQNIPEHTLLVLDEAYFEYAENLLKTNSITWLDAYPNLVITRTFSKIYGLAGIRLGYAVAHPDVITMLQRIQLPFTVSQVALNAGCAALEDREFIKNSLALNSEGIQQLQEGFIAHQYDYVPSAANFLTFDCATDGMPLYYFLLTQGIIIRPLHAYAMANYLRVSVGTTEQNTRFLNALGEFKCKN
jgi:histidinol-phosphate aminotransferase